MKSFKDWNIRSKLILPLLAVVVLGGGGIISAFTGMYYEITSDALPEERALDGIRRASLELLGEYREFMLAPSDSTQQEIEGLKKEIEEYEAAFARSALSEESETHFVETIEAAEQNLKRQGDRAIAVRRQLMDQIIAMEAFETVIDNLAAGGPADTDDAGDAAAGFEQLNITNASGLEQLVNEYLSEIHQYVMTPNDTTRQEIAAIELSLEQVSLVREGDAVRQMLAGRLLEAGRGITALTDEFLAELEALEETEDDLLDVLDEAGSIVARETDNAFGTGFAIVTVVILAFLAAVFVVGYLVSQGIRIPLTALANATDRLGKGDLSVRADMTSKDEIGVLATAFNRMAVSLGSSLAQRHRAEEELEEEEQRNERLIASLPGFVYVCDDDENWTMRFLSENAESVLGYARDEVIGNRVIAFNDLIHPDDRENVSLIGQGNLGGNRLGQHEYRIRTASGSEKTMWENSFGVFDKSGKLIHIEGYIEDITDRKQTEEQLQQAQKMEAVGQLTGGIAHDFNNMLAAILGNLEMLGDHLEGNAKARRSLDIASRAASRAAELTHRLLAFSRQQHLEPQAMDLGKVLSGMRGLLQTTLTEAVEMDMQVSGDLRPVLADPAQLESTILNLAINAGHAMPEGGRLVIESTNTDLDEAYAAEHAEVVPGSYVMLAVSDNGLGMPSDVRERVFEPFFTTKEVGEGTGLGLSMIYGFIKQLGGHVTLYSEEGHGTCVKLYLPVAGDPDTVSLESCTSRDDYQGGAETVLVVEDDADVSETALVLLEHLGYRVLLAENGPAALRLLEEHRDIDLLFTDVVMPGGMSGLDLAREVSCRIPNLKVLCTSGYSERALVKDGNFPWEIEWIGKPYLHKALAMKVRQVLDKPQA